MGSDQSSEQDWCLSDPRLPSPYAKVGTKEVGASGLDPRLRIMTSIGSQGFASYWNSESP